MAVAVERKPSRTQRVFGETPTAWLWVTPAVVIILGLSLLPMAWALLLSFQHNDLVTPSTWVGLDNYQRLLDDATFRGAVQHTLIYTAVFVPLSVAGGLGIALMLNRHIRFVGFYRTLVFVPYIMSATAQGVLFSFVFDSQFGVANAVLDKVGIAPQGFLQDPGQALWVIILIGLWSGIGFSIVVYLAALQDIPRELVEAASIDGARRWGVFRHVDAAGAHPGHGLPARVAGVPGAPAVRPRLRDHARRAAAVDHRRRALRLAAGVPVLQRRLRRRRGLRARVRAARGRARVGRYRRRREARFG